MSPAERERMRQAGRQKLAALKRHAARLRQRALTAATIAFAAIWIAIFVQMATGNDPALSTSAVSQAGTNLNTAAKESVASDPERRRTATVAPTREENEGESLESELLATERLEAEQVELEAAEVESEAAAQAELEAIEAEELEAVTTGQS